MEAKIVVNVGNNRSGRVTPMDRITDVIIFFRHDILDPLGIVFAVCVNRRVGGELFTREIRVRIPAL